VIAALASVKHIARERIALDSSLQDLGVDSLDKVTLLFELEKTFQISIPDEQIGAVRTVGDIVEGISSLVDRPAPDSAAPESKA
jgi:acyl carrier protein